MKANELRIGNWVRRRESDTNIQIEQYLLCNAELCKYQPIPLTEEWLLKFGFVRPCEEHRYNTWEKYLAPNRTFNILPPYEKIKYYGYSAGHRIGELEIKYIHQLQNLYFALTDEELTIGGNIDSHQIED